MALIYDNRLQSINDFFIIRTVLSDLGKYNINSFVDYTQHESSDKYFKKEVRISLDNGITFSTFVPLTNENINGIYHVKPNNNIIFEFKYSRIGTDNTGYITFEKIILNGTYEEETQKQIIIYNIKIKTNNV